MTFVSCQEKISIVRILFSLAKKLHHRIKDTPFNGSAENGPEERRGFVFGKLVRSMVNVPPDSMAISVLCRGVRALTERAPGVRFTGVSERQGIEEKEGLAD